MCKSATLLAAGDKMNTRILFCALAALAAFGPAVGSAQVTTATFYGIVTDPTSAAIPNATVTLVHEGTSTTTTRTTDHSGEVAFDFLRVGSYILRIEGAGFKRYESKGIELVSGQTVRQTFVLEVGALSETVSVEGTAPLVSTA